MTFKSPTDDEPFTLRSLEIPFVFARRLCLSLGKVASRSEALDLLERAATIVSAPRTGGALILHELRWDERRLERVVEDPGANPTPSPAIGQGVGTLVELGPEEFWAGFHVHAPLLSPDPGGMGGLILPEDSPSRAWLKLEEAVRFFGLTFSEGEIVVELGCAPGGVILALLRRGVSVIGVDPAKLAPVVMTSAVSELPRTPLDHPWVYHCRKPAALVAKRDLGHHVSWFMSDMNQSPEVALKECARMIRMCPAIHSALITLKLTDFAQAANRETWFQSLREMGFRKMRLQQLALHHHELALLATDRV